MKDYRDKVAVITGAGRGIGRGIALHCAKEGMKVVLAGFGMESLTKTAADLEALGMQDSSQVGHVVSGLLPIESIDDIEAYAGRFAPAGQAQRK